MTKRSTAQNRCIDGTYFQFSLGVAGLVDKILAGRPLKEISAELGTLSGHSELTERDALEVLRRLFGNFGINVDLVGDSFSAIPHVKLIAEKRRVRTKTAIKAKITILPEKCANCLARIMSIAYNRYSAAFVLSLCLCSLGVYVWVNGLSALSISFAIRSQSALTGWDTLLVALVMILSCLFHELGHCSASARFGRPVKRVGFGIYWLFPVMFSDVSSTWELAPKQRVLVDIGGVYFQFMVCGLLAISAVMTRGDLSIVLQICIVLNLISIGASLDPMLKFDGYWVFSDFFDVTNLRKQSDARIVGIFRASLGRDKFSTIAAKKELPLTIYAILSSVYGLIFAGYLFMAIWNASVFAVELPSEILRQSVVLYKSGNYYGILSLGLGATGKLFPLVIAPIIFTSAFAEIASFARTLFGSFHNEFSPTQKLIEKRPEPKRVTS